MGGTGGDVFVIGVGSGTDTETIMDFEDGQDFLTLANGLTLFGG